MKTIHVIHVDSDLIEETHQALSNSKKGFFHKEKDESQIALVVHKSDGTVIRFEGKAVQEFSDGDLCKVVVGDGKVKAGVIRDTARTGAIVEYFGCDGKSTKKFFGWESIMP